MNIYQIMQSAKNPGVLPVAAGGGDGPEISKGNLRLDAWLNVEIGDVVRCDNDDDVDLTYGELYEVEDIDHYTRMIKVWDDAGDEVWIRFSSFDPEASGYDEDDDDYDETVF